MMSILSFGRLFTRAVINRVYSNATSNGPNVGNTQQQNVSSVNKSTPSVSRIRLLTVVSGFSKNQGPDRVRPGKFGDDAYFIARHQLGDVIGVADGVGGWRAWGIDPGEFSHSLMKNCERLITNGAFSPAKPADILARAYDDLVRAKQHVLGSSTACVVVVRGNSGNSCSSTAATPTSTINTRGSASRACSSSASSRKNVVSGLLSSANLGDSGYMVVRDGEIVERSQEQQHYFNTPFQLSLPPPGTSGQVLSDHPSSAASRNFEVEVGDLVLLATDGVFDNLPEESILKHLKHIQGSKERLDLQDAANTIALRARELAFDDNYMSPFALNANNAGITAQGGKPDDITVVLAIVLG